VVAGVLGLSLIAAFLGSPAAAAPFACNECVYIFMNGWFCDPADSGESGNVDCNQTNGCKLLNDNCTGGSGGGEGGGGGGGGDNGGGDTCSGGGFCPAECFNCDSQAT